MNRSSVLDVIIILPKRCDAVIEKQGDYTVCLRSSVNPTRKQTKQKIQTIFFIALQNISHPLQHTLDTVRTASVQQRPLVESIAERLSHDFLWHSRPQNVRLWWPPSSGETGRSPQESDQGSKEGDQAQLPSSEPGIDAHVSHYVQELYRGAVSTFQSSATLAESTGYAVAIGWKLPGKMRH